MIQQKLQNLALFALCILPGNPVSAGEAFAHSHESLKQYSMHGNYQKGVCTKSIGANQFEVWKASIDIGSKTPRHAHDSEEVFILLKGKILAVIGDEKIECSAPGTLICPANVYHQIMNTGDEPTEHLVILGIGSKIFDVEGQEMSLPWRQ